MPERREFKVGLKSDRFKQQEQITDARLANLADFLKLAAIQAKPGTIASKGRFRVEANDGLEPVPAGIFAKGRKDWLNRPRCGAGSRSLAK